MPGVLAGVEAQVGVRLNNGLGRTLGVGLDVLLGAELETSGLRERGKEPGLAAVLNTLVSVLDALVSALNAFVSALDALDITVAKADTLVG